MLDVVISTEMFRNPSGNSGLLVQFINLSNLFQQDMSETT